MKKCDRSARRLLRMMKLTTIFLLLGMMTVSADGFSQKRLTVSIDDGTLDDLFTQIQQQSDYLIFYRDDAIDRARFEKVNLRLKNKEVGDILDKALKGTHLTYRISGRQIAVVEGEAGPPPVVQGEVSGTVQDTTGMPLPGVTVQVKGTNLGTTTDAEGNFTISATSDDVLVFSLIGFISQEV